MASLFGMGRKKSSNGRGSEGGGDASSLSILGKGMHNLKQWKRRTEEQVLGAMGYSDRSKDPKVDAALEKFTQQKEEIQTNIKDLKHLGERWRKFFIACAECESMRYRAAGLYDAIAASSAHAAILNAFDERVYNVLDATLVHVKDIEESIKKRQLLVLEYDHHNRLHGKEMEKIEAAVGDADALARAEKSEGERRVKLERSEVNLTQANTSLMRKLRLYDRAHGEIMNGVMDVVHVCHTFYCAQQVREMGGGGGGGAADVPGIVDLREKNRASLLKQLEKGLETGLGERRVVSAAAGTSALVNALEKAEADMMHEEALRVFGKDLDAANTVPLVLIQTLAFLEAKPDQLATEGIFRIPGNSEVVDNLREQLDRGTVDLADACYLLGAQVPEIATLLKLFFRELPEPLLPSTFCNSMMIGGFTTNRPAAFSQLSAVKQEVLRLLMACLSRVAKEDTNKMDSNNLAVCFAPTLCGLTETSDVNDLSEVQRTIELVKQMIDNAEVLFSSDGGLFKDYPIAGSAAAAAAADATGNLAARAADSSPAPDDEPTLAAPSASAPLPPGMPPPPGSAAAAAAAASASPSGPFDDQLFDAPATPTGNPSDVAV
eukprot:CAMPEP_0119473186 /NCGR_PEP_ID=MMETSP1344-20130328/4932_1 /TAXON_ID=236787 /ORGANISM="Florenciella parvula, Strain CCMP2471" /LENGTH=604 /DNA_ID=CAMNT_0007506245 /DNA_START=225 /DNA_END=2039 /DNA_ORIENTATION=+